MNFPGKTLALIFALALTGCEKLPQSRRTQATEDVEMDLLVVRLAESRAVNLITHLRDRKRAASTTEEVMKIIAAREATLLGWPLVVTHSGERAVFEQIDEFRYATEYNPPSHSKVIETPNGAPDLQPPSVDQADGAKIPATSSEPAPTTTTTETIHEASPTSFETRNTGVTLEVEPMIDPNGRTIRLNLRPQHTRVRGMQKVTIEGPKAGAKVVVEQPEFVTHKVTTSLSVEDGDYTLLGVFNVADMPGQTELFILHTRIKRIEVPAEEPPPTTPAASAGQ